MQQRRRRKARRTALQRALDSEFAKPLGALLLLGLLYLAFKSGLVAWIIAHLIAPIGGEHVSADEIYESIKDKM